MRTLFVVSLLLIGSLAPASAADVEANKKLYREFIDTVFNKRQPQALDRYVAEGLVHIDHRWEVCE